MGVGLKLQRFAERVAKDDTAKKYILKYGETCMIVSSCTNEDADYKHYFLPVIDVDGKPYVVNIPALVMDANYIIGEYKEAFSDIREAIKLKVINKGNMNITYLSLGDKNIAGWSYNYITKELMVKRMRHRQVSVRVWPSMRQAMPRIVRHNGKHIKVDVAQIV